MFAQDPDNLDPLDPEIPLLQFRGYCAVCDPAEVGFERVGMLDLGFTDEFTGFWTLDYEFIAPPTGSVQRTDQVIRLSEPVDCE